MRLPFFATNKHVEKKAHKLWEVVTDNLESLVKLAKQAQDDHNEILVLEGRINRLEGLHSKMPGKPRYSLREWTRMSRERRQKILAKMTTQERQTFENTMEAMRKCRKR